MGKTKTRSKIYSIWAGIKQRCYNKNSQYYKNYGGRGITMSREWCVFENFYDDMNYGMQEHIKKHGSFNTTIERVNNNGNYCKKNCIWTTRKKQANNTRRNRKLIYMGEEYSLTEFAEKNNIDYFKIKHAVNTGVLIRSKQDIDYYVNKHIFGKSNLLKSRINKINILNNLDKVSCFPFKYQSVFIYRYGLNYPLENVVRTNKETGRHFGIGRHRVGKICNTILRSF